MCFHKLGRRIAGDRFVRRFHRETCIETPVGENGGSSYAERRKFQEACYKRHAWNS